LIIIEPDNENTDTQLIWKDARDFISQKTHTDTRVTSHTGQLLSLDSDIMVLAFQLRSPRVQLLSHLL